MIVDERMVTYIRSLERPENPVIEAIEQEALDSFVPIIRKETQSPESHDVDEPPGESP